MKPDDLIGRLRDQPTASQFLKLSHLYEDLIAQRVEAASFIEAQEQECIELRFALKNLVEANEAVQLVLCDGPGVPGFDRMALPRAQQAVVNAEELAKRILSQAIRQHSQKGRVDHE